MNLLAVLAVLLGALASSACTTLTPKEETPEELQRQLLSGELLQPGERVRLVTTDESEFGSESIPDAKARLVFFRTRDSALYVARRAAVSLDGEKIAGVGYGSFLVHEIDAGDHGLRADMWDMPGQCELILTAIAGETYYFQVDPRSESFGAFASGDLATQLLTTNVFVNVAGGVTAVAAESYGKECGGAFRIYPVDAATAITRLGPLRRAN